MSDYSLSVPFNNIALLYVYAISLKFLLFDYKLSGMFWEWLLDKIEDRVKASTKKTVTTKTNLLIYSSEEEPNSYWLGLYQIFKKLLGCPFCKGCWAGYILYFLFIFHYQGLDITQILDFALFSWSCGIVSLISTSKLGI